jgi:hypothetical protein
VENICNIGGLSGCLFRFFIGLSYSLDVFFLFINTPLVVTKCLMDWACLLFCRNRLTCFFTVARPLWKAHTRKSPPHLPNFCFYWLGGHNSRQGELYIGRASWRGWDYSGVQSTEYSTHKFVRLWHVIKLLQFIAEFYHFTNLAHISDRCLAMWFTGKRTFFMNKYDNKCHAHHMHPSLSAIILCIRTAYGGSIIQNWEASLIAIHLYIQPFPFPFKIPIHFTSGIWYVINLAEFMLDY